MTEEEYQSTLANWKRQHGIWVPGDPPCIRYENNIVVNNGTICPDIPPERAEIVKQLRAAGEIS